MFLINKQNIGLVIKQARKNAKLKQYEIEEMAGFSEKHLCRVENGKYLPKLEHFLALTSILHLTLADFGFSQSGIENSPQKSELVTKILTSNCAKFEIYSAMFDYVDKVIELAKYKEI